MKKTHILMTLLLAGMLIVLLSTNAFAAYNYGDVMDKAIAWYDANRCGTGVATNNVFSSWRGNCHTSDSKLGGFHDAGDHVKFQLPAAFSASAIGFSIYEFRSTWPSTALTKAWQELKLFCDYSMSCWNGSTMVIQIGDGGADHGYWGPPENQTGSRPTSTALATDIIAQTAASLALMNINYKSVDSAYATTCLNTAKAMFNAVKTTSTKGTAANGFYTSSSYADDLAWASIWLYLATNDSSYLANTDAWMDIKNDGGDNPYQKPWTYCWDDSTLGNTIMMYKLTGGQKYYDGMLWNFNWYANTLTKTPYGLPYLNQWAVLRYDSAEAGLMYIMYKEFGLASSYITLANKMVDYTLGTNPTGLCYVTNYTSKSVKHPHHRANEPNRDGVTHNMLGALAGGPNSSDNFTDDVNSYEYTEVALDYNACFLLGLAGRKYVADGGQPGTPPPTPTPYPTNAPGNGTGLEGNYYSGTALAGTPLLTRVDPTVDFNWAGGSPATNIPSDGFSARWTGYVQARSSQTYTFYLSHDDGARMWVNNVQVVNNWTDHAAVEDSGTIALTMGQKYAITVEFYESSGDASCQLSWSAGTTIAKQIIPQSQLYNTSVTPTPTSRNTPTATNTPTPTSRNTPTATNTPTPTSRNTPTPTPTGNTRSAFQQLEAESYNSQSGVQTETCGEGGQDVGYIQNGDYTVYNNIDFATGATGFQARVASATSGGSIEIRLDSTTGTLVGTCTVAGTGGWQTWTTRTCTVSGVTGVHNLYLRYTGSGTGYLMNFNWFKFTTGTTTPTNTPTPTPTRGGPTPTNTPTPTYTPTPTRGNTPTPTPTPPPGGYVVTYTISDWGGAGNVDIIIKNNTANTVNGWTLAWTFPGTQKITNMWNASYTQNGASVSATNLGYNNIIAANGGTVSFGFSNNYTGSNTKPTAITLNGTPCTIQ